MSNKYSNLTLEELYATRARLMDRIRITAKELGKVNNELYTREINKLDKWIEGEGEKTP